METTRRLTDDDCEDPYNLLPRSTSDVSDTHIGGGAVLYEGWCLKQSRVLRRWRRRWIVLTPTTLASFRAERDALRGGATTDKFEVKAFRGARILDEEEKQMQVVAASTSPLACFASTPLFCVDAADGPQALRPPSQCTIVQIRMVAGAPLLLDVAPDDGATRAELLAREFATAAVNAYCAAQTNLPSLSLCYFPHNTREYL